MRSGGLDRNTQPEGRTLTGASILCTLTVKIGSENHSVATEIPKSAQQIDQATTLSKLVFPTSTSTLSSDDSNEANGAQHHGRPDQPASPTITPATPDNPAPEREGSTNEADTTKPSRTVRFYDRVRITSGVGHSNRQRSPTKNQPTSPKEDDPSRTLAIDIEQPILKTADSSASGSYSSSISAPLRSSTELPPGGSLSRVMRKRMPLSNMLDSQETNAWLRSLAVERRTRRRKRNTPIDERTPLLQSSSPSRQRDEANGQFIPSSKPDPDVIYGRWPWRIFSIYVSALLDC